MAQFDLIGDHLPGLANYSAQFSQANQDAHKSRVDVVIAGTTESFYICAMANAHEHHDFAGTQLSTAAQGTLERSGEQWTTLRASVFDVLAGFDKPASAYDVTEALSAAVGRRVAANSVYRILDLFVGANLALRVESENGYLVNAHPDCRHDCIFLVCDQCGSTVHIDDDGVTSSVRIAAHAAGFFPERPVIEVRGRCRSCAA